MNGAIGREEQVHPPATHSINIRTQNDQKELLREMLPEFLRVVYPRESGLLDLLYSEGLLTEQENSSMSGKDVRNRRDQARKLFVLLNRLPVAAFQATVVPELKSKFPHIIPPRYLLQEPSCKEVEKFTPEAACSSVRHNCLRHYISDSRIKPCHLADMLYHADIMDLALYGSVSEQIQKGSQAWPVVFECLAKAGTEHVEQVGKILQGMFLTHIMPVPENLQELLSRGLHCTCIPVRTELPGKEINPSFLIGKMLNVPETSKSNRGSMQSINGSHSFASFDFHNDVSSEVDSIQRRISYRVLPVDDNVIRLHVPLLSSREDTEDEKGHNKRTSISSLKSKLKLGRASPATDKVILIEGGGRAVSKARHGLCCGGSCFSLFRNVLPASWKMAVVWAIFMSLVVLSAVIIVITMCYSLKNYKTNQAILQMLNTNSQDALEGS